LKPPDQQRDRLAGLRANMETRARVLGAIRQFFTQREFLEVETPVRLRAPAPEIHIDAEPSGDRFLRTSPELHMKRLLTAGYSRIFQMGACFRRGERGTRHNPEYCMLEWYRAHGDSNDILVDTKALVAFLAREILGTTDITYQGRAIQLLPRWERITVADAFKQFAGWDPTARFDADRFDLDMVDKVEPNLPRDVPVILADYPVEAAALARRKDTSPPVADRWELYIGGLELANAYSELTDAAEQRSRFAAWTQRRAELGKDKYPSDDEFLAALDAGMPPAGGIALGVDRLVMLLTNTSSLDDVMLFRE
jgi:elongation factor P--(R)-beta-lysine ligase